MSNSIIFIGFFVCLVLWCVFYNVFFKINKYELKTFSNKWADLLHRISYFIPFYWFCDNNLESKKAQERIDKTTKELAKAGLTVYMDHRSLQTLKTILLFFGASLGFFVLVTLFNFNYIALNLLKLTDMNGVADFRLNFRTSVMVVLICGSLFFIPSIYVKFRVKKLEHIMSRDIPVIQLFIILMLRSRKSVREIFLMLSQLDTFFKDVFVNGLSEFLLTPDRGFNYLYDNINDESFKATVDILRTADSFSIETLLVALEGNMKQVVEDNLTKKRRSDLSKLVYSSVSFVLPFLGVIVFLIIPMVVYGLSLLRSVM